MHIGMKLHVVTKSHPTWGEWIEIQEYTPVDVDSDGLTPHGVSGLKSSARRIIIGVVLVSPRMG